jgi:hypothetical protein
VTSPEALAHLVSGYTAAGTAAAVVTVIALAAATRALRHATNRPPVAVVIAALAAAACTAYSADTSWRFARDHLGMTSATERAAMFAAAELALFSMALMARQNLRTTRTPGAPGVLVWVITGVQVIPAFSESGLIGGFVRAFVGPVLAALLWHLAMGIELRHHKPDANNQAMWALLAREARERLMSRLGLAVRDRTAEQITRDRWTRRAVGLAARLSELGPKPAGRLDRRRATRLAHRLSIAVGRAQVGADTAQRQMLLSLLAARRHAGALATMDLPTPWDTPADTAPVLPGSPPRTPAGTTPVMSARQPRTPVSDTADITADARADKGADTPVASGDTIRPRLSATAADAPSVAALVRACLDAGTDTPDGVVRAVRAVRPDADIPTVKRTLRRERDKRTDYM